MTLVDFNEQFFNIFMKIESETVTVFNGCGNKQSFPIDQEIASAIIANFENVSVPSQYAIYEKTIL